MTDTSESQVKERSLTDGQVKGSQKTEVPSTEGKPLQPIIWRNVALMAVLHLLVVYGVFGTVGKLKYQSWLWCFTVGGASGLGVTAGAHRLWAHRAYKAKLPLRVLLVIFYSIAGHNPLFEWVRDHRVHHKYSETDADPHNAKRGFFFSHMGWLMVRKHPQVVAKGRLLDMADVLSDPVVNFHTRHFVAMQLVFCFLLPAAVPCYLWGETLFNAFMACAVTRYAAGLHCTWLVNSAAHIWGNKPYDRRILPAENRAVAVLAMGEGWHNYHHVFPQDYRAAELGGYALNLTTMWIDLFARLGWAYDLKTPSGELVTRVAHTHGDGSRPPPTSLTDQTSQVTSAG